MRRDQRFVGRSGAQRSGSYSVLRAIRTCEVLGWAVVQTTSTVVWVTFSKWISLISLRASRLAARAAQLNNTTPRVRRLRQDGQPELFMKFKSIRLTSKVMQDRLRTVDPAHILNHPGRRIMSGNVAFPGYNLAAAIINPRMKKLSDSVFGGGDAVGACRPEFATTAAERAFDFEISTAAACPRLRLRRIPPIHRRRRPNNSVNRTQRRNPAQPRILAPLPRHLVLMQRPDDNLTTIRKRVDEVNVVFTVTDKRDHFVKDLTENDFRVYGR